MNKKLSVKALVIGLGFSMAPIVASAADASNAPAVEHAVKAPLAEKSLLLDVERAGERLIAVGGYGNIVLSDDEGSTWRQAQSVPARVTLTAVDFVDEKRGWAVGHDAVILKTIDGGENWTRQYFAPEEERPLLEVQFRENGRIGYALGAYSFRLVSNDGGKSWVSKDLADNAETDLGMPIEYHLHQVTKASNGVWYMSAEAGMAYRSLDKGETWDRIPPPYDGSFFGALPLLGESVLMFGLQGSIYRTDDGGDDWTEIANASTATLNSGLIMDDGTVVLVGNDGAVLVSKTGGQSFQAKSLNDRKSVADAIEISGGKLLLVGEMGARTITLGQLKGDI
ncbi:glycosyl hydrolase, BNR repeat [gamma proteobacterium HTCC5015]|nr:glycosyl hydrolase, BNR repeat [gamma proteobacterium HTCC5015]